MKSGVYITCCCLLLCGCAQTNWQQSALRPASRGARVDSREQMLAEEIIDRTVNESRSSVPLLRAQNPDHPGTAVTSSSATKTSVITHDAATLALIDKETRDFAPDVRERAVAALKAIPSESVPAVLQLWKAGLISEFGHPTSPVILAPSSASDLPVRTAEADGGEPDVGLGQKSPWPGSDATRPVNVPPDWNPESPTSATTSRTQNIARVNPPVYGYSPPFSDGGPPLGLIEGSLALDPAQDDGPTIVSRNRLQSAAKRPAGNSPVTNKMTTLSDWQQVPSGTTTMQRGPSNSLNSQSSPQITPRQNSQPTAPRQSTTPRQSTAPRQSGRPAAQLEFESIEDPVSQPAMAQTIPGRNASVRQSAASSAIDPAGPVMQFVPVNPLVGGPPVGSRTSVAARLNRSNEPLIQPQSRGQFTAAYPDDRSTIQRAGYSDPDASINESQAPLLPGQLLPGFERESARVQNPIYERQVSVPAQTPAPTQSRSRPIPPREVIHGTYGNDFQSPVISRPPAPAASRGPSPDEALAFLVKATEAEVDQLRPGRSATELQYYIERHVYLRLLYMMSGETEWAMRPIPNIPTADQEFWTRVLWGVQNYFDLPHIPNHAERAAQTISQFNTAMLKLKERAPLELKNVTFCHTIEGFGEYETWPKDEFSPGKRVLVYAEIANFHSQLSAEGIYRTRLKSTIQIVSAEAPEEPIEVKVYPVTEDYCRNHRRDYFHSYVVEIPVRCVRGEHELKLIIEDEQSGKVATSSVPFTVR